MPFAVLIDQISSCYFTYRQVYHLKNSNSTYPSAIFAIGQTIGGYLLFGSSSFLLDSISIAGSQIMLLIMLAETKIYQNIIMFSLIITFSFYKFLHTKNERNYFYQKHKNQQWLQIINKTIRNELIITKLESGHLQLHDLNKKAKSLKIHGNLDDFSNFLENIIVDKKKSHISIDQTQIQNTLKSYLLVRLSNLQDGDSKRPSKTNLLVNDPPLKSGTIFNNYESQQMNLKCASYNHNANSKTEYNESKRTLSNIKNLIRKKSDSRKLNPPSIISKQLQSTRPSKQSDPKVNTMTENQGQTINNFVTQNATAATKQEIMEQSIPDVIYCDYIVNDKVAKKYKISVSEVYIDQYLLVMSFEENNTESQRELKKQNDYLNELLIRSHMGYMQMQQNQLINLSEMNYADLKLNQYLQMNSVFALTQHIYLQKRNRMPIKVQEFNLNGLIEGVKQLFPQLIVTKDQSLNDANKQNIKNDQMRIKFILISIISSIFSNQSQGYQKQIQLDSPIRNRTASCYSNQMKSVGAPLIQFLSPPCSARKQVEQVIPGNAQLIEDNKFNSKQQLIPKDTQDSIKNFELNTKGKSAKKSVNKPFLEFDEDEDLKHKFKQQDHNKTKFGTPKLLHANYNDFNEEITNNFSLTKERNRRAVIDAYSKTDSNLNNIQVNPSDIYPQFSQLSQQFSQTKSILNAISHHQEGYQQQIKKEKDNQSKISEKLVTLKNTDEDKDIDLQSNYQETQNEAFEDLEEVRNTFRQNKQLGSDTEQSFDRQSRQNYNSTPSMSIKLIEKQKDYQKDSYEIKISFQPSMQQQSPIQTNFDKRAKQTIRGISATLNSMIGNVSDFQQLTRTYYSNTNNSIIEDVGRKQNDLDQTLNEIGGQVQSNRNNEHNFVYFTNLNGNQDELINKIEERVLLECIKQVCNGGMEYIIDKTGTHIITFSILSDLPLSSINQINQINQIIPDKKRAVSVTSYYSNNTNNNLGNGQGVISQTINNFGFSQKDKLKSNGSAINYTNQQLQSQTFNNIPHLNQNNPNINPLSTPSSNQFKTLNQKSKSSTIKSLGYQLKQNNYSTSNSSNINHTAQFSPRKRQTSLPIVNEKPLYYQDIKEDESLENNVNNSIDYIKTKQKRYCNRKNSTSMTSLEKSPIKNKFLNQGVAFEKPKQVIASNSVISENKYTSPKIMQQSIPLSGSQIQRNKVLRLTEKSTRNFTDCIKMSIDDSSYFSEEQFTALHIESERKQENFIHPRAFNYSMKRNETDYH